MSTQENNHQCEQPSQAQLCARGCGFFANPPSNLCSKCYREHCAEEKRSSAEVQQQRSFTADVADALAAAGAVDKPVQATAVVEDTPAPAPAASAADGEKASDDGKPVQLNTSRCFECNKRIGLTGFKCRCGYVYCASHRYAEKHNCGFDYKSAGRQTLATNNPVVAAAKVQKL